MKLSLSTRINTKAEVENKPLKNARARATNIPPFHTKCRNKKFPTILANPIEHPAASTVHASPSTCKNINPLSPCGQP